MRYLFLSLLAVSLFAHAEEEKAPKWYEENFVANAEDTPKALAMARDSAATDPKEADRWFRCGAVTQAQFKHAELFVNRDDDANYCNEDTDCAVGNLGGFCGQAAHKVQLNGYQLFLKSSDYAYLQKAWKADKCQGPVGLCMPIKSVVCEKQAGAHTGKCVGKIGTRGEPTILFSAAPAK